MAIVISGVNNNDKITASDGTIDLLSGVNYAGIITAPAFTTTGNLTAGHLNIGSGIQLGNAGVATATTFIGNLTGNVNATSNLLLQIGGSEKFRVGGSGQLGIGGENYGTSGQVLTSGGSGSAATWSAIPSQVTIANNADNRVITGGSGTNLNGEANLIFNGSELYPASGIGTAVGHRLNYRRNPPQSRTNTGSASIRYYKIGEIVLNGSESSEINIYGTAGYSAGQEVAGKTTIIMRATNGGTLVGFWYEESLGAINLSDVRWKYTGSNNVYELWVQANNYSNIAPFVRCTGNGYTSFNTDTGSNTAPSGSTGFSTYNRKIIGTTSTIRYNSTDTTFHRNIKMDSGYGIDFSATSNATGMTSELFSDYEEGEVTITTTAQNGNAITVDGGYNKLTYTKIGNVVNIFGYVYFASNSNADGFLQINSLPFTVKDAHGASAHARFVNTAYLTRNYAYLPDGAGYYNVQGYANESNTWLRYYDLNGSGRRIDTLSKFLGSGTVINVNFAYLTA